jgi:hypothetical protein
MQMVSETWMEMIMLDRKSRKFPASDNGYDGGTRNIMAEDDSLIKLVRNITIY